LKRQIDKATGENRIPTWWNIHLLLEELAKLVPTLELISKEGLFLVPSVQQPLTAINELSQKLSQLLAELGWWTFLWIRLPLSNATRDFEGSLDKFRKAAVDLTHVGTRTKRKTQLIILV